VSKGTPKAALIELATEGLAINIEVPESTIAESKGATYLPLMFTDVNLNTHQASNATG